MADHIYAQSKSSYETYQDEVHGVFVANKSDLPTDACQTVQSVWTSDNVTVHKSRKLQHADILEIKGAHPNSESLSIILKTPTQVCGRTVWQTAIPEMYVLYLSEHDSPLTKHPIHTDELDQWIYIKSLVMSSVSATELSLDRDFNQISYEICENNRQLLISQLRDIKSEGESLIFDTRGNPTLPIKSGELVYLFHCTPVMGRIRSLPNICSQELPVITDEGVALFMKPTSRRVTTHYTPRVCSSVTPAGFNLGTATQPHWVYVDQNGNPYRGPQPRSFNFSQLARHGVDMPEVNGLYTNEQLLALQEQTTRGDAILSISNHLAARIIETKNHFLSYNTHLNPQLQQALESSTTPWPYSLINLIPSWVRATFTFIFAVLLIGVFAKPAYSLLLCMTNSSIGAIDFFHSVFCGHAASLRALIRTNRAHQELAGRVNAATGVGETGELDHLVMASINPDSKLQAQMVALQAKMSSLEAIIGDNYETLKNSQDTRTRALNQNLTIVRQSSDAKDLAHEEALRKHANQTKALELRLAKLEAAQPPPYAVTALTKSSKKK